VDAPGQLPSLPPCKSGPATNSMFASLCYQVIILTQFSEYYSLNKHNQRQFASFLVFQA